MCAAASAAGEQVVRLFVADATVRLSASLYCTASWACTNGSVHVISFWLGSSDQND